MQGSESPRIFAHDLACRRGDRVLFRRLSLDLGPGTACHVTGANGSGKTTLIRTLAGLTPPLTGTARCEGAVGLFDERIGLDPERTLGTALDFWFALDGASDPSAVLERLCLSTLVDVPVRYLSTGQRKRAGLARLLGQNAPVWLLDEPLSGLDTASQALVSKLIAEHLDNQGTALIASHQALDVPGLETLAIEDFAVREEALP
ncbi:MAG: heme ABC exporter ATP-binding protein CcmA [Erythrobacter sp.]|uniref:heme ABC exporter ATP-binding protein CcmA n=1 Tax=Erythrobacter sp. TaxID=1042 RepID=UPI00260233E6|nr:heme ABC exporter ATP-binding protein CcmA [Erythrobacter sp.]MDJ0979893.1 heme ABC exporter ATP-binding protein CcmA [Erythrobacter sp.]